MHRCLEIDDAGLADPLLSLLVFLDDIQVGHHGATILREYLTDLAALPFLTPGQHLDQVIALDARQRHGYTTSGASDTIFM
jgi:hypothetical protein